MDLFARAKDWGKRVLLLNYKAWIVYLALVVTTLIGNFLKGPNEVPDPIPEPPDIIWPDGWVAPSEDEIKTNLAQLKVKQGFCLFSETEANQVFTEGKDVPLWKMYQSAHGKPLPSRDQKNIGTCVSLGFAGCVEVRLAVQTATRKGTNARIENIATEVIYGGSRYNIHGRLAIQGDGSTGSYAVRWLSEYGICERKNYPDAGVDLSEYSVDRSRDWGNRGVPSQMLPYCKPNLCTYALVQSSEECLKALETGCPVGVCSNVGFGFIERGPVTRDSEGRLRAVNNWNHCMFIAGYREDIKSFLIVNSWGSKWVNGPKGKYDDIPDGSFWAEWNTVDRMLKQRDSYAISGVNGFKKTKLEPKDWAVFNQQFVKPLPFNLGVFDHVTPIAF
jgi:hypothetical protein